MRPRQTPTPVTAFAWLETQKHRRIVECKVCDEDQAVMYRIWEPTVWRDRLPFGCEVGQEIEQPGAG